MRITGFVQKGDGIGRGLGFPTINLDPGLIWKRLAFGVYRCQATVSGKLYPGALHYGFRKTFGKSLSLEIYLIGFSGDASGEISVEIFEKIREVRKFRDTAELKEQITKDIRNVTILFGQNQAAQE